MVVVHVENSAGPTFPALRDRRLCDFRRRYAETAGNVV